MVASRSCLSMVSGLVTRRLISSLHAGFLILKSSSYSYGLNAKGLGQTHLNVSRNLIGTSIQSGALFSFDGNPSEVVFRVGVSFKSADQACANAEEEVGDATFEDIVTRSKTLWNEKLSKIEIDLQNTPANVTEMLYSSLYRASLTPVRQFVV
jgi:putative alpha-1,2-mannosidase